MSRLFTPVRLGALALGHRVVHAPTTRLRAPTDETPGPMMADCHHQRASASGLVTTESAHPSHDSRGYLGAPGIHTDAHVADWRRVTDAVHAKGGLVVMQVAHDGRQRHADLGDGRPPAAPSVVPFEGRAFTRNGRVPVSPHRALEFEEIPALVEGFRRAAERARDAGFDGIEPRNANGHLADTFLQDGTNRRTDAHGGSLENRMRFGTEVTELDDGSAIGEVPAIMPCLDEAHPEVKPPGVAPKDKAPVTMRERRAELEGFAPVMAGARSAAAGLAGRAIPGPHGYARIPAVVERGRQRVADVHGDFDARPSGVEFVAGERLPAADTTTLVTVDFATRAFRMPLPAECAAFARRYGATSARPSASA